jgi:tRNA A-37 threonylcarbamoyl transferase component Bud32
MMVFENVSVRTDDELPSVSPGEWLERVRVAARVGHPLKDYQEEASTRTFRADLEGFGPVWLKEYPLSNMRKVLSLFRESRARRVWWISEQLRSFGCEVPRPVLLVEVRLAGILRESYLATEWIGGRINLADWYRSKKDTAGREAERMILRAVRTAAGFHRHGAIHGDLKWTNYLLPAEEEGEIVLVDLDSARFGGGAAARGKDLARFAISALEQGLSADMADRIFEEYCGAPRPPEAGRIRKAYEGYIRKKLPEKFR